MNYTKCFTIITLSIIFMLSNLNITAKANIACPAGQTKNSQGKCVKKSRVTKAKATQKTLKSSPLIATNRANNAINAYNKALTSTKPDATKIQATQQAAIKSINNLISVYNQYLEIITSGKNAVSYVSQIFANPHNTTQAASNNMTYQNSTMDNNNDANMDTSDNTTYISSCDDGSTAMCDDGTAINTLRCDDGSTPDSNGMCLDGSLVICPQSGNSPVCSDGTTAW